MNIKRIIGYGLVGFVMSFLLYQIVTYEPLKEAFIRGLPIILTVIGIASLMIGGTLLLTLSKNRSLRILGWIMLFIPMVPFGFVFGYGLYQAILYAPKPTLTFLGLVGAFFLGKYLIETS